MAGARPQDTIQMFSRLNPQVQQQVLQSMGVQDPQSIVQRIGQNRGLQADSPNIVGEWNSLFGTSVDVGKLGDTIFSDSVHAADADHNYRNYGALTFTPGQGLQSNARAGQVGEVNRRGLRQAAPYVLPALGLALAAFGGFGALGSLFSGGAEVGGAIGGADATLTGAFDSGIAGGLEGGVTPSLYGAGVEPFAGAVGSVGTAGGGSSFLSQLNSGRQLFNTGRTVSNLFSGGQAGQQGGGNVPTGGGAAGGLGDIGSILGMLGLGRSSGLYGGGVGTPSGATDAGNRAADRADPWGASGGRASFASTLTPDSVNAMLGRGPGGFGDAIQKDPAFQFERDQGINTINMGDAAQGTLRSGNRMTELQAFGTGLASKYENDYFNRGLASLGAISGLAGANGQSNPSAAGQSIISGFTGATNLQNGGLNGLFGGAGSGALGGLFSGGSSGISGIISRLFGGGSGGVTSTGDYTVPGGLPPMSGPGAFDGGGDPGPVGTGDYFVPSGLPEMTGPGGFDGGDIPWP